MTLRLKTKNKRQREGEGGNLNSIAYYITIQPVLIQLK